MPPPRGGGALLRNLSDNYAHSGASLSGQNATQNGATNLTPQEQLLAGTLELDPENDPVIYITDYGLEIKSHNVGEAPVSVNSDNGTITVSSTTWNYISAGGKEWIIIGSYSKSSYTFTPSIISADKYSGNNPDNTDAGNAVESANVNGLLQTATITIPAFINAAVPSNGEIPQGCVLCLSAEMMGTAKIGSFGYVDSPLRNYIENTIYGGTSELSLGLQSLPIIPQTIRAYQQWATSPDIIENAYLFALAGRANEGFAVTTYLEDDTKRNIGATWWLRSGNSAKSLYYAIGPKGQFWEDGGDYLKSYGVRPAFVLQLYST